MYKIGYIDEDPDQVAKYKRDLRDYFEIVGYNISKGLPISDLIEQVYKSEIDLLFYYRLRPNWPLRTSRRLRLHYSGYGRLYVAHGRAR